MAERICWDTITKQTSIGLFIGSHGNRSVNVASNDRRRLYISRARLGSDWTGLPRQIGVSAPHEPTKAHKSPILDCVQKTRMRLVLVLSTLLLTIRVRQASGKLRASRDSVDAQMEVAARGL